MKFHFVASVLFAAILTWIYEVEIATFWQYMRFFGFFDLSVAAIVSIGVLVLTSMLPAGRSARSYLLTLLHYFFFIPSLVYFAFNTESGEYIIALSLTALIVYVGSGFSLKSPPHIPINNKFLLFILTGLMIFCVFLQGAFGGINSFNLDLESVYEYRAETMAKMPALFGYLYSNVANVIIPGSIVLALYFRRFEVALVGVVAGIILFAMAHHKSIIFTTFAVFFVYWALARYKNTIIIAIAAISILVVCMTEVLYLTSLGPGREAGIITSYIARRALLVPPMLDVGSIEIFSDAPKYFWSTSKLGLGLADNPYDVPAPYLLGMQLFQDPTMSANPGLIGSGYSNAGLIGVILYATIISASIAYFDAIAKKIGAEVIAALCFPTIMIIFTSTDLTTAILTHGFFMLLLLITVLSPQEGLSRNLIEAQA